MESRCCSCRNSSIMTEKLARRGLRVHQDYEADALTQATVGETMEKDAPVISAQTKVGELAERIARHDPAVARHEALLILDDGGQAGGDHYAGRRVCARWIKIPPAR